MERGGEVFSLRRILEFSHITGSPVGDLMAPLDRLEALSIDSGLNQLVFKLKEVTSMLESVMELRRG
jgi:hypothetical protein